MAAAEACRGGDAQVPRGLHAAFRHTGLGIGHIGQHALAVFQKGAAFVREADAPSGAHQQLDAQVGFQRVQPAAHDGRGHAFGLGSGRQTAARGHRNERFKRFEFVHARTFA